MTLDEQISRAVLRVADRALARDTRGEHDAIAELRALRIKRMKRDRRAGLYRALGRVAAAVLFVPLGIVAVAVMSLADQAYASNAAVHLSSGPSWGEICAAWGIVVVIMSLIYIRIMDVMDRIDEDNP